MNKQKWNSLSRRVQKVFNENSGEMMARDGGNGFDKNARFFRAKTQKAGHTTVELSEADIQKGIEFVKPVHEAWIKNNANGQKIYDTYLKIVADYRAEK
jgi:TRAP-type C4-dicarboxylate transport system substrate-binding protein